MSPSPPPHLVQAVLDALQRAGVRPPIPPDTALDRAGIYSIQALVALADLQRRLGLGTAVLDRLVSLGIPLGQHTPVGVARVLEELGPGAAPP
ncbi:MAG: hypothetical protein RL653_1215 [Pseudomonadota bacterium]|jgi:hypothetical protein